MCKKTEVQVVMTGHSISVCDMTGHFLRTWEVNKKFKYYHVTDYLKVNNYEPNDVSQLTFPWLKGEWR